MPAGTARNEIAAAAKAPGEPAVQIVELGQRVERRMGPKARLVVAHHDVGHEGRRDEHVEQREDQVALGEGVAAFLCTLAQADADLADRGDARRSAGRR
jgi:hypothetical protein